MTVERWIMAIAGSFIVLSTLLAVFHSLNWLWFTGFVGANLFQAAFTGFCPMAILLKKLNIQSGRVF